MLSSINSKLPFGLASYSFSAGCGFLKRDGKPVSNPMSAFDLLDLANKHNLSGIEVPLAGTLPDLGPANLHSLKSKLRASNAWVVADSGVVEEQSLRDLIPLAAMVGAKVIRVTLSRILEGNRGKQEGGWRFHLQEVHGRLRKLRPALEEYGVILALENHQDATSEELVELCEDGGGYVGVTLDVANPLAVAEDPLEFARRVGPWIRNIHLKDYKVYQTRSGYLLVRCALGEGVIPWAKLLPLLGEVAPEATANIELAALYARHIPVAEQGWWDSFPPRDVRETLPVLRMALDAPNSEREGWRTPWELGAPLDVVAEYEMAQFEKSVDFLKEYITR